MERPILVVATTNHGKVQEFRQLLHDLPLCLRSLTDFPPLDPVVEDGLTYVANAAKKATVVARATMLPALADDSGLEVDALDGKPGLHSARFAGREQDSAANIDKLLKSLEGVPMERRSARFRCSVVLALPSGRIHTAEGTCEGRITTARHGSGGFGYDSVFLYEPAAQTFAELPATYKDRVSHRAVAIAALRPALLDLLHPVPHP